MDDDMNTEQLKHIFRFQLEAGVDYEPTGNLTYLMFEENKPIRTVTHTDKEWDKIGNTLHGFTHEGYRDRIPTFVKIVEE